MTLDGFCDHTVILPDEEIHQHYMELLLDADAVLYGRITYQLMQFWQTLVKNPSGEKSMDDFAVAIDKIPKIVYGARNIFTRAANCRGGDVQSVRKDR